MIIGLSGKRGSGKDTVATFIQDGEKFWKIKKFASKLKSIAALLTGLSENDMYSQEGKAIFLPDWGMTVGEFQQKLGTEAIRNGLHSQAWVLALLADYNSEEDWLITDCRFPNEAEAIKAQGGVVIRVEGNPAGIQGDGTRDDSHPSETALDDYQFDYTIQNNSTLDQLEYNVLVLMGKVVNKELATHL
jgi:hypothetical protein